MKQGVSKIRNHVIARVFRELNLIEQWGSGIRRIIKASKKLGLPPLKIMEIAMRVRVIVPLAESLVLPVYSESPTQLIKYIDSEQVSEQVSVILKDCQNNAKSKKELLKTAGLANVYLNYKRHIAPLLEQSLLEMTVPDKPNSRLQKYRLTEKGRMLVDKSRGK